MNSSSKPTVARRARRRLKRAATGFRQVPGPSTNPSTNLLIASVAMRGASILMRRGAERGLLRARFDPAKAQDIVVGRSMMDTMLTAAAARVATRSVPGFLLVTGGLLAKTVFDRSLKRRDAMRRGERALEKKAENAPE